MWEKIKKYFKKFRTLQQKFFNWLFLLGIFGLALGITSVIGRLVGAKFLGKKTEDSSWQKHSRNLNTKTMY